MIAFNFCLVSTAHNIFQVANDVLSGELYRKICQCWQEHSYWLASGYSSISTAWGHIWLLSNSLAKPFPVQWTAVADRVKWATCRRLSPSVHSLDPLQYFAGSQPLYPAYNVPQSRGLIAPPSHCSSASQSHCLTVALSHDPTILLVRYF